MEGHCSTGQSPQCTVVPMEEEYVYIYIYINLTVQIITLTSNVQDTLCNE